MFYGIWDEIKLPRTQVRSNQSPFVVACGVCVSSVIADRLFGYLLKEANFVHALLLIKV